MAIESLMNINPLPVDSEQHRNAGDQPSLNLFDRRHLNMHFQGGIIHL
jgi:hypothetical protein